MVGAHEVHAAIGRPALLDHRKGPALEPGTLAQQAQGGHLLPIGLRRTYFANLLVGKNCPPYSLR